MLIQQKVHEIRKDDEMYMGGKFKRVNMKRMFN